jgi:hypothetical protein
MFSATPPLGTATCPVHLILSDLFTTIFLSEPQESSICVLLILMDHTGKSVDTKNIPNFLVELSWNGDILDNNAKVRGTFSRQCHETSFSIVTMEIRGLWS